MSQLKITVRKMANRIVDCFYPEDAPAWVSVPLHRLTMIAEDV